MSLVIFAYKYLTVFSFAPHLQGSVLRILTFFFNCHRLLSVIIMADLCKVVCGYIKTTIFKPSVVFSFMELERLLKVRPNRSDSLVDS